MNYDNMSTRELYDELRAKIYEINVLYRDITKFAQDYDLYLCPPWAEEENPSGFLTGNAEDINEGWTASDVSCGYRAEEDY